MATNASRQVAGVEYEELPWHDSYKGSKEALIASGVAKPEWFPDRDEKFGKRGHRVRRSFKFKTEGGEVSLRNRLKYWVLHLPISKEERDRRCAEWTAECDRRRPESEQREDKQFADERGQKQLDDERQLAALMRRLPPLADGLSESEREHLRVLRALSDRKWELVLNLTELYLLSDAERGELAQPLRPFARLELVVDNEAPR